MLLIWMRAVVHGDLMAGAREVAGHRVAHHAQAQKGDFAGWVAS
jgi:hypothetical protein